MEPRALLLSRRSRVSAAYRGSCPTVPSRPPSPASPRAWHSNWVPLGRFGRPADSAGCVVFLASELAGWVTGTVIHADGGALAAAGWYRDDRDAWTNMPVIKGNSTRPAARNEVS